MNNQEAYRATILPVPEQRQRPLWSVMIPTYNCANYLRETLASVLAQDLGTEVMQIEVVDDFSTKDDPEAVVQELGDGRVSFYRQPQNVGYIKNFNTCLQRARAHLVHILHGDDCVLDGFYTKIQLLFENYPEIGGAFCRHIYIDEHGNRQIISRLEELESGILSNHFERIFINNPIQASSMVVRRQVYERVGGFDNRFTCCCEDWEMWVRVALHYPVAYEVEPLAMYRIARQGSLTKNSVRSGRYAQDVRKATQVAQSYLSNYFPVEVANELLNKSREAGALGILELARQLVDAGDIKASMVQIREALKSGYSPKIIMRLIRVILKMALYQVKQTFTPPKSLQEISSVTK
ncbi:MAG: glycosyltransferase [Calothrix sp. C42_A2020_038]|nr:glycosyltransferase [Calothrix sp. C42_A2020_038]